MKPKIQLVGGCASSFMNGAESARGESPGNDAGVSAISKGGEAGALLEKFLLAIIKAVDASAGLVRVLSPNGHELRSLGSAGVTGACQAESVVETDCGTCGKSATKRSLETSNVDVCKQRYGEAFFGDKCQFVLAVPFGDRDAGEEPAGVITLFFANEKSMLAVGRPVVESYAGLIQVALQCVWKNEDIHQGNLLDERQSIANEIHDSLAQTLYFAKIRTSLLLDAMKSENDLLAFKCAQDIDEALESSQKTVRELVTHFRCQMDPKGLRFALQKLVNDFVARTNIRLDYVNRIDDLELPNEYELQVFLIIRESLVNIATHSGATIAGLTISLEDAQYQFVVEDNGAGVGDVAPLEGHYGLEIMRERALRIGGDVKVTSLEGQGTRVELSFSAPQD